MFASSATEAEVDRKGNDTFFADQAVSWKSLGLSDKVSVALRDSGFGRPSLTQVKLVKHLLICEMLFFISFGRILNLNYMVQLLIVVTLVGLQLSFQADKFRK